MRYFSMFSGVGGFELGIQRAFDNRPNIRNGAECVGYSEIDKYAIKVYERNFSGHTNFGDATNINPTELPDFDLLVGGFPCQAFSIAGKRAGFDDTRGTLFFDIARILKEKQPRNLVLENVKGLLSHDGGRTFTTILGVLADLGYFVEWQVLNSKNFGVPQNRERVFIVGHFGGEPRRKVFPITNNYGKDNAKNQLHDRQQLLEGNKSNTVPQKETQTDSYRIRRLTPKECERLQGFPDQWTKYGIGDEPISDTQRYKMAGNAVSVPVVAAFISKMKEGR